MTVVDIATSTARVRDAATGKQNVPVTPEQFDNWLAAHDREVAAKAWSQGYGAGFLEDGYGCTSKNPHEEEGV